MTVYIVTSEVDDYESRPEMRRIFETRDAAVAWVNSRITVRAAYDSWHDAWMAARPRRPLGYFSFPLNDEQQSEFDEIDAIAYSIAGEKPEYESGSYFRVYKAAYGLEIDESVYDEFAVPKQPPKPMPTMPTNSDEFYALPIGPAKDRWVSEYIPIADGGIMGLQDMNTGESWALGMYLDGDFFRRPALISHDQNLPNAEKGAE